MATPKGSWTAYTTALALTLAHSTWASTTVEATRTASPPLVDGRLDEACWRTARPTTQFTVANSTRPAKIGTTAYVLYDDSALYFGLKCHEPNPKDILPRDVPFDNSDVFRGDCVEIMLDPRQSMNDYYHFGINVSGARCDRSVTQSGHVGDSHWNGRWDAKTFVGSDFWSCEVAIPFFTLGITPDVGSTWRINLCREKKRPGAENSSIAEQGAFNVAGRFAILKGLDVDFRRYCYAIDEPTTSTQVKDGELNLAVTTSVKNETGATRALLVEGILIGPDRKPYVQSITTRLDADAAATLALDPFVLNAQGEYVCCLRVADPTTKRTLALRHSVLPVAYVPMSIQLVEPWYRDCIFETQQLKQVVADVEVRLDPTQLAERCLHVAIRKKGDRSDVVARTVMKPNGKNRIQFDAAALPYGDLAIVAELRSTRGQLLEETTRRLQKLPYRKEEVWLGRDGVWRVDGKPFFINGGWGRERDRNPYFNTYTSDAEPVKRVWSFWCPQAMRKELRNDTLSDEFKAYIRSKVEEAMKLPNLLILFLWDEPECSAFSAKGLEEAYQIMRNLDPYHPVMICNDSLSGLKEYAACAEINGFHPYPPILKDQRVNDFAEHVVCMDQWSKLYRQGRIKQTVAFLHQGFNYGDYGAVNQRVPNYVELRRQNLLNIILGATGIMQFNRCVAQYPELHLGIPHLTKELAYLGKAVTASTSELSVTVDHEKARSLLKEVDGELFLFVCNADMAPRQLRISVPGLGRRAKQLHVVSEGRSVAVQDEAIADTFDAFGVHVYTTSADRPGLLTVRQIEAEIDAANRARRKPGNLVFQALEGDGAVLRASSNTSGKFRRPDNGLWHVVDGVISTFDHYKCLMWYDATPNEHPDWIEIQMPKAHKVGRVVVCPFEKSLRDYAVQAFVDGRWQDLDRVTGKSTDLIEHRFSPVTTDRIRLWITATNTPLSQVNEIEVYGK